MKGAYGGTGVKADWTLARKACETGVPILLAGGLTPENVAEAIRIVQPAGVDVAGGVESAPGIKDPQKLRSFFSALHPSDPTDLPPLRRTRTPRPSGGYKERLATARMGRNADMPFRGCTGYPACKGTKPVVSSSPSDYSVRSVGSDRSVRSSSASSQ